LSFIRTVCLAILVFALGSLGFAAQVTGTVTNKTTNRPAVGDDVLLLKLAAGMQETARSKTDANGHYSLKIDDENAPHLIRVIHQNVTYHKPLAPGAATADVDVYDVAPQVEGVRRAFDVMRIEAQGTTMRVVELIDLQNDSSPPRTMMGKDSIRIALPPGAKVEQTMAAGPGGMPVNASMPPSGEKDHYSILFPVRPGENRFQVAYTMFYDGKAELKPAIVEPTENFAVSIPKSMQLTPASGSRLQARGEDSGLLVYVASNVKPGDALGFAISGEGIAPDATEQGDQSAQGGADSARPGGGMAAPVNTPDPLYKYRWWIIGAVGLLLVAGAAWSLSRPSSTAPAQATGAAAPARSHAEVLLDALKEELFELESQRAQGTISEDEYQKQKAALDVVLQRAVQRRKTAALV